MEYKYFHCLKLIVATLLFTIGNSAFGYNTYFFNDNGPVLRFIDKRIVNYGNIKSDDKVHLTVQFENSGDTPLYVFNVTTTCNCTKAQTDKKMYKPKEKGTVMIDIDAEGKYGQQTAVIRITTNSERPQSIVRVDYKVVN